MPDSLFETSKGTTIKFGKYTLLDEIGRGGFGIIYKALDNILKRTVAIKMLHPHLMADQVLVNRFIQEAQLSALLNNEHIVPIYEFDNLDGRYYLAMEYMENGSLKDLLSHNGKLSKSFVQRIAGQLFAGLEIAHRHNIIHRDLKPGNILFDGSNNVKITDFGFAKFNNPANSLSLSTTGSVIGTPGYIAPEIWKGQQAVKATDQYGLACIICEMCSGEPLFSGDSPPVIMMKHFEPRSIPNDVPKEWRPALMRALSVDPMDRFPTMAEFGKALLSGETKSEATQLPIQSKDNQTSNNGIPTQISYQSRQDNTNNKNEWAAQGQQQQPPMNSQKYESSNSDQLQPRYRDGNFKPAKSTISLDKKFLGIISVALVIFVLGIVTVVSLIYFGSKQQHAYNPAPVQQQPEQMPTEKTIYVTKAVPNEEARMSSSVSTSTPTPLSSVSQATSTPALIHIDKTGLCDNRNITDNCVSTWTNSPTKVTFMFKSSILKEGDFYLRLNHQVKLKCVSHSYLSNVFECTGQGQPTNQQISIEIVDSGTDKTVASGEILLFVPTSKYNG
ncbi:MAG TPA: serine/threonine-protein kinase [Brevefilum fermentans]|jgi:serine/threonine protein kinase|nr:serine/threonine-protein kinase [Chloroflexota bacterium]HQA29209.1 serine/threonine-protein kinase [Brevefilum fermentans]